MAFPVGKRAPLYSDGHHEPDLDKLSDEEQKKMIDQQKRSVMKWTVGWVIYTTAVVLILSSYFSLNQAFYYSGYGLIAAGGILAYSSVSGGNYVNTWGAYAGMSDLITQDIFAARQRMFTKWLGPTIGIILGIAMLFFYS